jgi:hypothetical protein
MKTAAKIIRRRKIGAMERRRERRYSKYFSSKNKSDRVCGRHLCSSANRSLRM